MQLPVLPVTVSISFEIGIVWLVHHCSKIVILVVTRLVLWWIVTAPYVDVRGRF